MLFYLLLVQVLEVALCSHLVLVGLQIDVAHHEESWEHNLA